MTIFAHSLVVLLAALYPVFAVPNPEVTAPAVLPRQISTEIVGYFTFPNNAGWGSYWCNTGYRYCTVGSLGACGTIVDTTCNVPRSCVSTSYLVDSKGSSLLCNGGTNTICATNSVFLSPGDTKPITSLVCRPSGPDITLYRAFPTLSSLGSAVVLNSATPVASLTSLATSTSTPSPSPYSSPASPIPTTTPDPTPKSKAWIAGPVIGGLVALAGIVAGVIFLRRRKANNAPPPQTQQQVEEKPRGVEVYDQKMPYAGVQAQQPSLYYQQGPQSPQMQYSPLEPGHVELEGGGGVRGNVAELGGR